MRLNTYQMPYLLIDDFARNAVDDGVVRSIIFRDGFRDRKGGIRPIFGSFGVSAGVRTVSGRLSSS
jgi:hypothetical protein